MSQRNILSKLCPIFADLVSFRLSAGIGDIDPNPRLFIDIHLLIRYNEQNRKGDDIMQTYSLLDRPLKVSGVPFFERDKKLTRLPDELLAQLPHLDHLGRRCPGARVAFKTDSPTFTVKVTLKTLTVDVGMSLFSCQSVQVMLGERENARHLGVVNPPDYHTKTFEKTFHKSSELEQITVYFPRNEQVEMVEFSVEDKATVSAPTPYKYTKPIVFYGSSITEGGCSCNTTNAYNAILSRWLDFDFYNLGFSGNAKGELVMADYINTFDMGAFVYDYDHNAPTVEHLASTHKPFFDRIREVHPSIPILMMTRPAEVYTEEMKLRRKIVKSTYDAAVAAGDKNVYFITSKELTKLCGNEGVVDDCHPNDFGFASMAKALEGVMETINLI